MIIWELSDLHLDTANGWDLPPRSSRPDFDVMVCAGDLVPGLARGVKWLAARVNDRPVVLVAGNHEFFGRDIDRELEKGLEAAEGTNVIVVQDQSVVIDDVEFFGATFWTNFGLFGTPDVSMAAAEDGLNDYRKIRKDHYARRLRAHDILVRNQASRTALELAISLDFGCRKRVVVTHHPLHPFGGRSRPTFHPGGPDPLLAAYVNDATDLLVRGIDVAISGHTHRTFDEKIGSARIISNAKGYGPWTTGGRWENPDFDPLFTFEI